MWECDAIGGGQYSLTPSSFIATKYRALLRPQLTVERSTSKANSLFIRVNIWYLEAPFIRYMRDPTLVPYSCS